MLVLHCNAQALRPYSLTPPHALAHNDCSIRKPGMPKISMKKNWGAHTKGVSEQMIPIDHFGAGGTLDTYRLTCYLYRDDQFHLYGIDSPVNGYSYFYDTLLEWLLVKMQNQQDEGPLENMAEWLTRSDHPEQLLISIGATRYTPFGESHFLKPGDVAYVVLYDGQEHTADSIPSLLAGESYLSQTSVSVLRQLVVEHPSTSG